MGEQGGLGLLPSTRREIVRLLRRHGELRAEELATHLGVTTSALRQQLTVLAADGYVAHREVRDGPGRPKHRYRLTSSGEGLFPRRYSDLATDLLELAADTDPALVERLFEQRGQRRLGRAREQLLGSFDERIGALASILDADGYVAEAEPLDDGSGGWRITEWNCAIFDVAVRYGVACATELAFLQAAMPDAEVRRVKHMVAGSLQCAYELRPRLPRRRR